jgi:cytochrome c-type biogenesis protein CcmE
MTRKRRRLMLLGLSGLCLCIASALILFALRDNLVFFHSPSDVHAGKASEGRRFRLGGMVVKGSLHRLDNGKSISFTVTDTAHEIAVRYAGIVPDLFREEQGVIVEGRVGNDGIFAADELLAKHDENYMPPEVAAALKSAGATMPRNAAGAYE